MAVIMDMHNTLRGRLNSESERKLKQLHELYPSPEQQAIIQMVAARTLVGAEGFNLIEKHPNQEHAQGSYFERLGSRGLSVALKQEPSVELAMDMRKVKANLTRVRNEFIDKVAKYYVNAVSEKIKFSDFPTDLTETQKYVLKSTENSGFVKTVTTLLSIINRVRKLIGNRKDENEQEKRLVEGLKQSKMFDLGYSNAVIQLNHNIKAVTENFDPSYLLDNMWQIKVAENYFGIKEFQMYELQIALLGENGIKLQPIRN